MPTRVSKTGSELFIVDNSNTDWKVMKYLSEWCQLSKSMDIATGYFEIGAFLSLNDEWQKVDEFRVLMGGETTIRTKRAFEEAKIFIKDKLDESLEDTKEKNDFLNGVPAIVEGLRSGKIKCKVYKKNKFHAKAYITHSRKEVVGSAALVGSSNFTYPGLTENIELNVQITGSPVKVLQEWFDEHWEEAEDVTPEILEIIERHIREYSPFEVYAKSLQEFFKGHEMTASEWELASPTKGGSIMYNELDYYQQEGYQALMKIASQYGGAFLCDGVGLGKTFIGLMLIERLISKDNKNVALFVPKAVRDVWEVNLERYMPELTGHTYNRLQLFNHTDLLRDENWQKELERVKKKADVIVIDEAHHFRNKGLLGKSRYWRLFDIAEGKTVFMLTATPINNHLTDLQHMIELFSRDKSDYFKDAPLGIHSLPGHFRKLENELDKMLKEKGGESTEIQTDTVEAEKVFSNDNLFNAIVVQRSRAYVKESQIQHDSKRALFPKREAPNIVPYDLKKTYGKLLGMVEKAFAKDKPLFSLAIYYPLAYAKHPVDIKNEKIAFENNRQREVVRLIRIQFLKRFESSVRAFEMSCETLMIKLLAWARKQSQTDAEKKRLERWENQHQDLIQKVNADQREIYGREEDEDIIDEEMLEQIEGLPRDNYNVEDILAETFLDLDQVATFLNEIRKLDSTNDDKLSKLINLLTTDQTLKTEKVLIFSEYMATARYLKRQLTELGIKNVDEIDSADKRNRTETIRKFAPYYNKRHGIGVYEGLDSEIRVLISTDVLSEGLNLQDATRLINYDIHWNPVRLMQRIGRIDRRLNPEIEELILSDHPEQDAIRGTVVFWNFLPPTELDTLLKLYSKVSKKTLRISKVFGIEGKKLLKPDDDYEALKEFNHSYEGDTTPDEEMHLEYQKLLKDFPELEKKLNHLPKKVFSGKQNPQYSSKAVFFCYALPAPSLKEKTSTRIKDSEWTEEAGFSKWYLYDLNTKKIIDEPNDIIKFIRSTPETPRQHILDNKTLSETREEVETYIKNTYLKKVQAPVGISGILKSWMELS
jgi:superfamily II DNA or RNA helicase